MEPDLRAPGVLVPVGYHRVLCGPPDPAVFGARDRCQRERRAVTVPCLAAKGGHGRFLLPPLRVFPRHLPRLHPRIRLDLPAGPSGYPGPPPGLRLLPCDPSLLLPLLPETGGEGGSHPDGDLLPPVC